MVTVPSVTPSFLTSKINELPVGGVWTYAERISVDGGADATRVSQTRMFTDSIGATASNWFHIQYFSNLASQEKLTQTWMASNRSGVGAANAPSRVEHVGKWINTSNAINAYNGFNVNTGTFAADTEIIVLGWDPADTHTDNFWEQLASVELGTPGDLLSSGTIPAKKYLWVQWYMKATGGNIDDSCTFNTDGGSNYNRRTSNDGGTDSTLQFSFFQPSGAAISPGDAYFGNMFIVNNSAIEKLCIAHVVSQNTVGAGNVPNRAETVAKWANTNQQITDVVFTNGSPGNYDTGSIIKVWGSD